jgi:hypothetical protein
MVDQFYYCYWFLSARWRCLDHPNEILERPEAKSSMVVDTEGEGEAEEGLIVARGGVETVDGQTG